MKRVDWEKKQEQQEDAPAMVVDDDQNNAALTATTSLTSIPSLRVAAIAAIMPAGLASSNAVKMAGYLDKRGRRFRTWKCYWFVLDGQLLLYFRSQSDYLHQLSPCQGSINLGLASGVRPTGSSQASSPQLEISMRSHAVLLRAKDRPTQERWLQALLDSMQSQSFSSTTITGNHFRYSSASLPQAKHFKENKKSQKAKHDELKQKPPLSVDLDDKQVSADSDEVKFFTPRRVLPSVQDSQKSVMNELRKVSKDSLRKVSPSKTPSPSPDGIRKLKSNVEEITAHLPKSTPVLRLLERRLIEHEEDHITTIIVDNPSEEKSALDIKIDAKMTRTSNTVVKTEDDSSAAKTKTFTKKDTEEIMTENTDYISIPESETVVKTEDDSSAVKTETSTKRDTEEIMTENTDYVSIPESETTEYAKYEQINEAQIQIENISISTPTPATDEYATYEQINDAQIQIENIPVSTPTSATDEYATYEQINDAQLQTENKYYVSTSALATDEYATYEQINNTQMQQDPTDYSSTVGDPSNFVTPSLPPRPKENKKASVTKNELDTETKSKNHDRKSSFLRKLFGNKKSKPKKNVTVLKIIPEIKIDECDDNAVYETIDYEMLFHSPESSSEISCSENISNGQINENEQANKSTDKSKKSDIIENDALSDTKDFEKNAPKATQEKIENVGNIVEIAPNSYYKEETHPVTVTVNNARTSLCDLEKVVNNSEPSKSIEHITEHSTHGDCHKTVINLLTCNEILCSPSPESKLQQTNNNCSEGVNQITPLPNKSSEQKRTDEADYTCVRRSTKRHESNTKAISTLKHKSADELDILLSQLTIITNAPLHSASMNNLGPLRRSRNIDNEPDYDIPRPHNVLTVLLSRDADQLKATGLFDDIEQNASRPLSEYLTELDRLSHIAQRRSSRATEAFHNWAFNSSRNNPLKINDNDEIKLLTSIKKNDISSLDKSTEEQSINKSENSLKNIDDTENVFQLTTNETCNAIKDETTVMQVNGCIAGSDEETAHKYRTVSDSLRDQVDYSHHKEEECFSNMIHSTVSKETATNKDCVATDSFELNPELNAQNKEDIGQNGTSDTCTLYSELNSNENNKDELISTIENISNEKEILNVGVMLEPVFATSSTLECYVNEDTEKFINNNDLETFENEQLIDTETNFSVKGNSNDLLCTNNEDNNTQNNNCSIANIHSSAEKHVVEALSCVDSSESVSSERVKNQTVNFPCNKTLEENNELDQAFHAEYRTHMMEIKNEIINICNNEEKNTSGIAEEQMQFLEESKEITKASELDSDQHLAASSINESNADMVLLRQNKNKPQTVMRLSFALAENEIVLQEAVDTIRTPGIEQGSFTLPTQT